MKFGLFNLALLFTLLTGEILAQTNNPAGELPTDYLSWWNIGITLMVGALVLAIFYRYRTRGTEEVANEGLKRISHRSGGSGENVLNADKELDWLRKNRRVSGKSKKTEVKKPSINGSNGHKVDLNVVKEKLRLRDLPIFTFKKLKPTETFDNLPISNDEGLMSAIEQVHEEFEEDDEIRELVVRVLAAFKTRNSVEALSQVALYDLSASLRSKAVTTLSEFDHESVFETILLSCADPTREVRASGARALFHVTFNRADAWARIAKSTDSGRKSQLARAAIEADLVERSFERLAHPDRQYAYEAFALVTLLIRTGELEVIMKSLESQKDTNVRQAILHTIKVSKNKKGLTALKGLLKKKSLLPGLQEEVDKTIEEMGFVTV